MTEVNATTGAVGGDMVWPFIAMVTARAQTISDPEATHPARNKYDQCDKVNEPLAGQPDLRSDGLWRCAHTNFITVGPGIAAVSIRASDGAIGFFDTVSPVTLTFNTWQRTSMAQQSDGTWEKHGFTFWGLSIGAIVQKDESEEFSFGLSGVPYMISIDHFSLGIGAAYTVANAFTWDLENLSILIPLNYQF